jgi:hypothetical protein
MKKIITYAAVGALLTFGSAVSARANTVEFTVSVSSLETAINAGGNWGGNCTNLASCGVLGIGLTGINSGTTGISSTISLPLGSTDAWTPGTIPSTLGNAITASTDTTVAFITAASSLSGSFYNPQAGTSTLTLASSGSGGLSATGVVNTADTVTFLVTDTAGLTAGTSYTLDLVAEADFFTGSGQNTTTKSGTQNFSIALTAMSTPEPSSMALIFAGIAGIALSRFRRVRA